MAHPPTHHHLTIDATDARMILWVVLRCNHYLIINYFPIFQVITLVKMEMIGNSGFVGLND